MEDDIRINFHCHTYFSDGNLSPEALADALAKAKLRFAALTDHNTLEGLPRFAQALQRRGITFITGVEITTHHHGREIHLLGYGFDVEHAELKQTLFELRNSKEADIHSIEHTLRQVGANHAQHKAETQTASLVIDGVLSTCDAITLIHRAGGKAFLAHPFHTFTDDETLHSALTELKSCGLDGIEAYYYPYTADEQQKLAQIAQQHNLLTSGGTDFHNYNEGIKSALFINIPTEAWKSFRNAIYFQDDNSKPEQQNASSIITPTTFKQQTPYPYRRRYFILRILIPTMMAIILYIGAIWGILLPSFENSLIERKREMIRELTNSAWSILAGYENDVQQGTLTLKEAQDLAKVRIESLRYGREGKDYFWLQDMKPTIIVHPYRKDLNGKDVSNFMDARGVRIFAEFSELVRRSGEGYIEYVWQWKDDPQRLEAKESYIKGFKPWGWVIGTGLYIEDVKEEIARIEQNIIQTSLLISGVVILLLAFVVQQSLHVEQERREAEEHLCESNERYRLLIEATSEGMLLILDGHCRYANPKLLQMLGISMVQLELMDLEDILPKIEENSNAWERASLAAEKTYTDLSVEGLLKKIDGSMVECLLSFNPIAFSWAQGFIMLARELTLRLDAERQIQERWLHLGQAVEHSTIGFFRAKADRRAKLIDYNHTLETFLNIIMTGKSDLPLSLKNFFHDDFEFESFLHQVFQSSQPQKVMLHWETDYTATLTLSLMVSMQKDEDGKPAFLLGTIEDISEQYKKELQNEALLERLQTSLMFLHEPIGYFQHQVPRCGLETPVKKAAEIMTAQKTSSILVETESETVIGIITDHDLRTRVLAAGAPAEIPVRSIMSAPIVAIAENSLVYEALMVMEEKGIQHIAVKDENEDIISILRYKDLIQFHRYGVSILTQEISRAKSIEQVVENCQRMPSLIVALLKSGARPKQITHIITSVTDSAVDKLIQLGFNEFGLPPAPFAFIALGSHGRREQTLVTDQDNAIIYLPPEEPTELSSLEAYFLNLGSFVCNGLHLAGFNKCSGNIMASNPRWCQPLDQWKGYFTHWISTAEPQELLAFNIFFDIRTIYGNFQIEQELRKHIYQTIANHPAFFMHLAQNAMNFSPPFRLFGLFYIGSGVKEQGNQLNLKDTLMPLISFARIYALKHKLNHTHTIERINALLEQKHISNTTAEDIHHAYDYIMQLRLRHQAQFIQSGKMPQNIINIHKLATIEEAPLKQAFAQISALQKKISFDFLGGSS